MTPAQRLMKIFAQHGVNRIISEDDLSTASRPVIVVRADAVLDTPLVAALVDQAGIILIGDEFGVERPVAAHVDAEHASATAKLLVAGGRVPVYLRSKLRKPSELNASYWQTLRKRETPYALLVSRRNQQAVEWRMFMGTYKGATDIVTKYVWPRPAFYATRWLAQLGVTPNLVTTLGAVLVVLAFWLFSQGYWAPGLASAWLMTFLDTVDGKLARTTISSSHWGNIFDHGIDLIHPPFWYFAWAHGLVMTGHALSNQHYWWVLGIILAGYVLQRVMEGVSIKWFGIEIHIWRPIDTLFRQITARRNPNLILMTIGAAAGRPDWGLIAVALWTGICLLLHGIQLGQAALAKYRTGPLVSWMKRPAPSS